ncbi:hypothetical protein OAQ34_05805 [Opitutales bacterium]|nr:hypothetical protein [Opitutales bacterium]
MDILPRGFFHRTVTSFKLAWVGVQSFGVSIHHRLILCLRHLILTEVKAVGQGDLMLSLIRSPTTFRSRTAHRKGARRAENHFHTDRGHGVCARGAVHL